MIFKSRGPRARLIRPADAGYASGVNPAGYDISAAAGLRLLQVTDPQDIVDPLEIAYLLSPTLGAIFAKPYIVIIAGVVNYVAADGVTPINPATLPAQSLASVGGLYGLGATTNAYSVPITWAPGSLDAPLPENLGPATFPRWYGLTL